MVELSGWVKFVSELRFPYVGRIVTVHADGRFDVQYVFPYERLMQRVRPDSVVECEPREEEIIRWALRSMKL